MLDDYWYEGYGSAIMGGDWVSTVMGRFLREWERRELAAGWRAGVEDRISYLADMAERVAWNDEPLPVCGDSEYPW